MLLVSRAIKMVLYLILMLHYQSTGVFPFNLCTELFASYCRFLPFFFHRPGKNTFCHGKNPTLTACIIFKLIYLITTARKRLWRLTDYKASELTSNVSALNAVVIHGLKNWG